MAIAPAPAKKTTVTLQPGGSESRGTLEVDAATLEVWNRRYAGEIGSARTDDVELQLLDEMERRAHMGYTWTETGDDLEIGTQADEWDAPAVRTATGSSTASAQQGNPRVFFIFIAGVALLLCAGIYWIYSSTLPPAPKVTAVPTLIAGLPPGDGNPGSPTQIAPTPASQAPVVVVGTDRLPVDVPRSLECPRLGQVFIVVQGSVKDGNLVPPTGERDATQIVWFPSPINWLFGMDESWTMQFQEGDVLIARMRTGRTLRFIVEGRKMVAQQEIEALAQRRTGLTLVPMPASNANSIGLVLAGYDPALEQADEQMTSPIIVGQAVPVGSAGSVTLTDVQVDEQDDATYLVSISGELTGTVPATTPILSLGGQLYSPVQPLWPASGSFTIGFKVPVLGPAQFWLGNSVHLELGTLAEPTVTANILDAVLTDRGTIEIVMELQGGSGGVWTNNAQDFVLMMPGTSGAQTLAVLQVIPATSHVAPGETASVKLAFPRPTDTSIKVVRLQAFDKLWEIALP